MSRPGKKSTSVNRRVRGLLLVAWCALCCALPPSLRAQATPAAANPAPEEAAVTAPDDLPARVRIEGATTLKEYVALTRLLQGAPGIHRVNVVAVEAAAVTFEVTVQGGATGLEAALAATAQLQRIEAGGARLVYRYQP
jgi:hypothetical protein